ncbi:MAG: hypothetical protein WBL80_06280 [Erysipelotrichaceae bacterium]
MRLKHLREVLNLSEEQMAANLVIPVERYRELEASQGDQHVSAFDVECDTELFKEDDIFNTEAVLRRMLNTSNVAVQIQNEENQKLRDQNEKLKRALVRNQLTKLWSLVGGFYSQLKFGEIDYRILELSGITRSEVDLFAAAIKKKFREDDTDMQL